MIEKGHQGEDMLSEILYELNSEDQKNRPCHWHEQDIPNGDRVGEQVANESNDRQVIEGNYEKANRHPQGYLLHVYGGAGVVRLFDLCEPLEGESWGKQV